MAERGMSLSELARRVGLSTSTVHEHLHTSPNLTLRTIVRLADALDLDVEVMLTYRS